MANFQYANNPQTTLSGSVTAGASAITVASAAGFPTQGKFTIIIDSEILLVTGVAGTTWTVERGTEDTSAASHNNNATVTGILTKASFLNANHFDVRAYGAKGDGSTNDTTAIQAAIDAAEGNGQVFIPPGTFIVTSLTVPSNVAIVGVSRDHSILKSNATASWMLNLGNGRNITIRDLKLDGSGGQIGAINLSETTEGNADSPAGNVLIENCYIDVSGGDFSGILLEGYVENVTIRGCHIVGSQTPDKDGEGVLIYRKNPQATAKYDRPVWIDKCYLQYGREGFTHSSTGQQASGPTWFTNNWITGQKGRGATFYNNRGCVVTGNTFENITQVLATGANADAGIVWVDQAGNDHNVVYADNQIRNCVGNGIYIEDVTGTISGWHISGLTARTADQFTGTKGITSNGGHGVVVAAAASLVLSNMRVNRCEGHGILIARDLGPHNTSTMHYVGIENSVISENDGNGIYVIGAANHVAVIGSMLDDNGQDDLAGNSRAAIKITDNTSAEILATLVVNGCYFKQNATGGHYNCIGRTAAGGFYVISNNVMFTNGGPWVSVPTNSSGIVIGNDLRNNRGFNLPVTTGEWHMLGNRGATTGNVNLVGGFIEMYEITDAAAPGGNTSRLYTRDNGAGKTQLVARFPTGAIQVVATEP